LHRPPRLFPVEPLDLQSQQLGAVGYQGDIFIPLPIPALFLSSRAALLAIPLPLGPIPSASLRTQRRRFPILHPLL
jgi:hypothetical protein